MDQLLVVAPDEKVRRKTNTVVVLVARVSRGSLTALAYARSLNPDRLVAVSVVSNAEEQDRITGRVGEPQDPGRAADAVLALPRAVAADHDATSTSSTTVTTTTS